MKEIEAVGSRGESISFQAEMKYTQDCSPGQIKQFETAIQKINKNPNLAVQAIQRVTDRFDKNHLNALYGADRTHIASATAASFSEEWWFSYFYKERKSSDGTVLWSKKDGPATT